MIPGAQHPVCVCVCVDTSHQTPATDAYHGLGSLGPRGNLSGLVMFRLVPARKGAPSPMH